MRPIPESDIDAASLAKKPGVTLRPVQADNWQDCIALKPAPGQEDWIPSNLYSIAEAQFYPEARSRAVYNLADQLVGYALYGLDIHTGYWKVFRLMIDHSFQQQGYGRAALGQVLEEIGREPDGDRVWICYQDANTAARQLYAQFGFEEQEIDGNGKVTALWRRNV